MHRIHPVCFAATPPCQGGELPESIPSCPRVSRGFEEHVSEPANARRDAARRDGRGVATGDGVVGVSSVTLLLVMALAGCMLGPDYQRPAVDAPNVFRFEDKSARDLANTAWWEQFRIRS